MRLFPVLFLVLAAPLAWAAPVILPETVILSGPNSQQHLLVVEKSGGVCRGEVAVDTFASSDATVVEVVDGVAHARGNGIATLSAMVDGEPVSVTAQVTGFALDPGWSFNRDVLPVLSKQGCNMGACHGSIAGKGGFRLSLRGWDPVADYYTIAREANGRRIEMADPARSLLVTKPTMATPHKGSKRLDTRSRDYRILAEWVAQGAVAPDPDEAKLDRIEVLPAESVLKPGDRQRFLVTAHYADGTTRDVTQWAKFTSADETVATIDDDGNAEVVGHGVGSVTAWFSSKVVLAEITSPFANDIPDDRFTGAPRNNFIDQLVLEQLRTLNLEPSRRTTDSEFVRRAYLDTIGVLPTAREVRDFLDDPDPAKRDRLVEYLLGREEFVDYWAYRWSDVFLVNGRLLRPAQVSSYYKWIRENVEKNTPWDEMTRQIITARGSSVENGATNFYAVHQDPETMAENVSQAFLGLSLNCAKCHDHPLEKWTNNDYYAFANLFGRVRAKGWGGDPRSGDGVRTLYVEPRGDLIQPSTGKPRDPAPLDAPPIDPDAAGDRREVLADWLTSTDNETFARAVTNRVWAAFFGRGLVEPVDDLRVSNPASNEPLFDALSDYLVANDFDLKQLMRAILRSETYQRSSEVVEANRDDSRYFSRYYPRRHMAEILHDAIVTVTGTPARFDKIVLKDGSTQKTEVYAEGTRAVELFDSAVQSYFLETFGRNEREIVCECERSNQPSMIQALHLANGETINEKLSETGGIIDDLLALEADHSTVVEEAYLRALSRLPTKREAEGLTAILAATEEEERRVVMEDLLWALMTSREFLFQR